MADHRLDGAPCSPECRNYGYTPCVVQTKGKRHVYEVNVERDLPARATLHLKPWGELKNKLEHNYIFTHDSSIHKIKLRPHVDAARVSLALATPVDQPPCAGRHFEALTTSAEVVSVDDHHPLTTGLHVEQRAVDVLLPLVGDDVDLVVGALLGAAAGAVGLLDGLDDGLVVCDLSVAAGPGLLLLCGERPGIALVGLLAAGVTAGCLDTGGARLS